MCNIADRVYMPLELAPAHALTTSSWRRRVRNSHRNRKKMGESPRRECMSVACMVASGMTSVAPTVEMKTSFFRPALPGPISGVGRVDFVVDGFLIIECDSRQFHEGWEKQRADRRRDLAAAARGYFTLRVLAEDLLHPPEAVEEAVRGLLGARAAWPAR